MGPLYRYKFTGIHRKIQLKYQPSGRPFATSSEGVYPVVCAQTVGVVDPERFLAFVLHIVWHIRNIILCREKMWYDDIKRNKFLIDNSEILMMKSCLNKYVPLWKFLNAVMNPVFCRKGNDSGYTSFICYFPFIYIYCAFDFVCTFPFDIWFWYPMFLSASWNAIL